MKTMTGHEIRSKFIKYFEKNGHTPVASSSLIPFGDDTLLFTNAGMNQFKNLFLGIETRPYKRAVTSQKCVRAGGKHNDLENVGFTARHHTFFEMLGNFSFGDYFKKDAIRFAWEFLTKELGIERDKLYVTVYTTDDEAADIWHDQEKIPRDRISRFEADNFWMMGDTGPCGPCSEIFYDHGKEAGCGKPDCKVGCSCDRYVEIWNLVFMQYNQTADGKRTPLPKPSVDTGSGLERVAAVMQKKTNNYDTDLFEPLVDIAKTFKELPISDTEAVTVYRVLADHARATAFLIADGAVPSNEGRGYVLRRIMRRAIRFGRKLSQKNNGILSAVVVNGVIAKMKDVYPELSLKRDLIAKTVSDEEDKFLQTLDHGTQILNQEIKTLQGKGKKVISGETLFKLYDTYGFPVDLTQVIAREHGFTADEKSFEQLMEKAKAIAKTTWKGSAISSNATHLIELSQKAGKTEFTGYDETETHAKILLLSNGGKVVSSLKKGEQGLAITDRTCFYGESGGQIGDQGILKFEKGSAKVIDATKTNDTVIHHLEVLEGELTNGKKIHLIVNESERRSTARNHSATHLLHAALRKVLGPHVTQAGSSVAPDRLRFDFTHSKPMSREELDQVEKLVNTEISLSRNVKTEEMNYQNAIKAGAMALFGEKYGDKVRVIQMGDFSTELCGGTHVHNTGDIRLFKVLSEAGVSSGVRRLEALTGDGALNYLLGQSKELLAAKGASGSSDVENYILKMIEENKKLEKEIRSLKGGQVDIDQLANFAKDITGGKFIYASVDLDDRDVLNDLNDRLKNKIRSGVIVLIGKGVESNPISVSVTKDLVSKYNAGKILQIIAAELGGRGGGRPDFAQGAVKDLSNLEGARIKAESIVTAN